MRAWLKQRFDRGRTARDLYGSIVTQARQRAFYADCGVPDTARGRLEVIVLHLVLVVARLETEGFAGRRLARALGEAFVVDMDDVMREMTFGDLAVPREIKQIVAAFYDRHTAYKLGLAAADPEPLAIALRSQLAYLGNPGLDVASLSAYMRRTASGLATVPASSLMAGRIDWPQV